RTVMQQSGSALMGIGMATGVGRGREAARRALDSPLIGQRIRGATGVLLSIMGPPDLTLQEVTEAAEAVREAASGQGNIIFGTSVDETLGDQLWVTVIATGFERREGLKRSAEPERSRDRSPLRELEIDDDLDVPSFLRD
ncbi:MAG: cell division protein FtsZ, partial [Gaiellales bacterium]|nr:cell division protein FtsZ [Gaiellales bacterium]